MLGVCETLGFAVFVSLSVLAFPGAPDTGLDASWQVMLVHAHEKGLQFGRELIFTWGPWGYLFTSYHLGALGAAHRIALELGADFLIALALMGLCRPMAFWRRALFTLFLIVGNWFFQDLVFFSLIALIGLSGLMRGKASVSWIASWAVVLGFVSQVKFTYFSLGVAAVGAAALSWTLRGSRRRAVALGVAFSAGTAISWVLAGQDLDHLYPYVMRGLQISAGYPDAMGYDESWPVFLIGASLAIACVAFLAGAWKRAEDRGFTYPAVLFLGFCLLVSWKEGFTRADGHVLCFFGYVLILSPLAAPLIRPGTRFHWFDCAWLGAVLGTWAFDPSYIRLNTYITKERIRSNLVDIGQIRSLPGMWQRRYEVAARDALLPRIKTAVGTASVDCYNFNTATPILNGMNLASRPVFQSYSAYTPSLEGWNLRYYESPRAPEFLLWSDEQLDGRYPGQDDAMLLARLPGHYAPLFKEGAYWLFRRDSPVSREAPKWEALDTRNVALSEEVLLPEGVSEAVWLRADARPNTLGRLRAVLYKPALLDLVTTDTTGKVSALKVLPRVARDGFILTPTLSIGADMAALMRGEARTRVRSFHFDAPDGQSEFWGRVDLTLYKLTGLQARLE